MRPDAHNREDVNESPASRGRAAASPAPCPTAAAAVPVLGVIGRLVGRSMYHAKTELTFLHGVLDDNGTRQACENGDRIPAQLSPTGRCVGKPTGGERDGAYCWRRTRRPGTRQHTASGRD